MKMLLSTSVLFCFALVAHLIVWKIKLPKRQTRALLLIFFATFLSGLMIFNFTTLLPLSSKPPLFGYMDYLKASFFFISLTLAYIITYSAIEVDSPSLVIVMRIADFGLTGINKELLEAEMTDEILLFPRIKDLVLNKMVYLTEKEYRLTFKGAAFVKIFILYRCLLKAPKGG